MATVGAAVGGMLASAVIKVVIGQINSTIAGEIKLHKNMRKDLEDMKMTLESVEAVLSDAERRSITDNSALLWLKRLKDAMNDISDMLEDFEVDTNLNLLAATMKKIKMPHKMKEMQKRLQKITDDRNNYRVLPEARSEEQRVPDVRETAGNVEEAEIIGRTEEKLKILACLSENTTQGTTIFPIWGFGGIGKTTLVRSVFNDSQFKEYSRVWVYVSQTFDLKKIGNIIISQLSQQSNISDLHSIHTHLRELFTGKKILIILDDLWEKNPCQLEKLKAMLKQGEGSTVRVMVTTREESIAMEIGTVAPYKLPPFADEMCWDIIKQKCNFETCPNKERLEPIGKEIATKCGGVALAAQSLGHMLKLMPYEIWDSVRTNHIWELSISKDTPNTHEVLASLLLSFSFMPPGLKLCFAYCGIFPKGYNIIKDELIHQWIALGFVKPSCRLSTWQLGQMYVRQLLEMSFLQYSKTDDTTLKRKYTARFTMHDLVHDLARSVMADEFDLEGPNCRYAWRTWTDCKKLSTTSPAKLRALHIVDHGYREIRGDTEIQFHRDADSPAKYVHVLDLSTGRWHELPDSIDQFKQLRYLSAPSFKGRMDLRFICMLSKLNYLNLHFCYQLSALPDSIGEMKCLMHLDLSSCRHLRKLPLSFGNLRELLYLDLSGCYALLALPESIGEMKCLMHLDLSCCTSLRKLPLSFGNLRELLYLNLSNCDGLLALPESIGEMKGLMHLDLPKCRNLKELPLPFGNLRELLYLDLSNCDGLLALPESIGEMKGLMHLDLSRCRNLKELPLSFGNLRELLYLDLSYCDGLLGIPQALGGLNKLQHLDLSSCKNLRGLPDVIHKLTELCYLNLSGCMHHIFDSSSTDQAERFIRCICMLPNMEQLHLSLQSEFPLSIPESASRLRKLALNGCYHVTRIPECVAKMDTRSLFGLLPDFDVYSDGTESNSNLDLLEHTNPEQLCISMLGDVKFLEEAHIINLREKKSIADLTLGWNKDANRYVEDMELLRELLPPTTLRGFEIYGYSSVSFPYWLMSTINYLPNLVRIRMSDLPNCRSLPPLGELPNLRMLSLSGMKSLEVWNTSSTSGEDSVNGLMFPKLEEVNIGGCPRLKVKPHLPRAASWSIHRSDNVLISWGESMSHTGASSFSSPVSTKLDVRGSNLPLHQWNLLHHLPALSELKISLCSELASSPEITQALHSLRSLILDTHGYDQTERVEWFADLTSLQQLTLLRYERLQGLPGNMRQLTQLQSLSLQDCQSITSLPEWLGELTSLTKLEILCCPAITTLPESIQQLTNLQQLEINGSQLIKWCAAEENKAKLAHIEHKLMLIESDEDEATPPTEPQHCGCLRFI